MGQLEVQDTFTPYFAANDETSTFLRVKRNGAGRLRLTTKIPAEGGVESKTESSAKISDAGPAES